MAIITELLRLTQESLLDNFTFHLLSYHHISLYLCCHLWQIISSLKLNFLQVPVCGMGRNWGLRYDASVQELAPRRCATYSKAGVSRWYRSDQAAVSTLCHHMGIQRFLQRWSSRCYSLNSNNSVFFCQHVFRLLGKTIFISRLFIVLFLILDGCAKAVRFSWISLITIHLRHFVTDITTCLR